MEDDSKDKDEEEMEDMDQEELEDMDQEELEEYYAMNPQLQQQMVAAAGQGGMLNNDPTALSY